MDGSQPGINQDSASVLQTRPFQVAPYFTRSETAVCADRSRSHDTIEPSEGSSDTPDTDIKAISDFQEHFMIKTVKHHEILIFNNTADL